MNSYQRSKLSMKGRLISAVLLLLGIGLIIPPPADAYVAVRRGYHGTVVAHRGVYRHGAYYRGGGVAYRRGVYYGANGVAYRRVAVVGPDGVVRYRRVVVH